MGTDNQRVLGFSFISGSSEFPLDHRIFNAASFCSAFLATFYLVRHAITGGADTHFVLALLATLIFCGMYYLSRVQRVRSTRLRFLYFLLTFFWVMSYWGRTGGITGFMPLYYVLFFMIYLTLFRLRYHVALTIFLFSVVTALGMIEISDPALLGLETGDIRHIKGAMFSTLITMFFSLGLVNYLKVNYSLERQKALSAVEGLKESEAKAKAAKEDAIRASKVKSEFLSTMSHEIRTPMNAVIGMTHLLMEEDPKKEQVENLEILKFSAENLMTLINDILDFSKIEAGKVQLEKIDFSLRALVNSVKESCMVLAEEKELDFILGWDNSLPDLVKGDPTRLTQILNNLVSNAVKFTADGSVAMNISLVGEPSTETCEVQFAIKDTGIGIAADRQEHIFDKFSQASASTTREFGGTGLGLAITKKLVELMGSKIELQSELHRGAEFSFKLLLEKASDTSHKGENSPKTGLASLAGLKILLADDNRVNIRLAKKFLDKWQIETTSVYNGKQAVAALEQQMFDLVLMDLQMPEMDGAAATKCIREMDDPIKCKIPVIAITASSLSEELGKITDAGMNDFISKPFRPDELHEKISRYTQHRARQGNK